MTVKYFCPRWGGEAINWDAFMAKVKAAGYDGIEWAIAANTPSNVLNEVWELSHTYSLSLIAQHYDTRTADFNEHFDAYGTWLERVRKYPWARINSQTGKDHFTPTQNAALIKQAGKGILHETHRGKFSFAAHITQTYLEILPELRITLDASHWVNVAESWLEDQQAAMERAISRTDHIHARVGYPQGPQVPDPRAPEWKDALHHHLRWWDAVVRQKKEENGELTITTEFGPYPYMAEMPNSRKPLSDQWEINVYMLNLLRERYA